MRRQDREIVDTERIWEILRSSEVCRVAFCGEDWPYIVPMNFGILDEKLYFHCAAEGTKLNLVGANPNVCFEVESSVEVFPGEQACDWSVRYRSVVGFGRASVAEDPEERRAGVGALLAQYSDREIDLPQRISSDTVILRIDVCSLTGKESPAP
ncbi:pyridoxamine 5'-phosphate oxidase family protein [Candidatus Bipolaricaulota bacterium]